MELSCTTCIIPLVTANERCAPPLFGVSIVAVALLIIMGCLVQAIREALATEVSVEIGKPISLLSNQALGPVLHSLIQMRVPRTGLAKLNQHPLHPPPTHPPTPHSLSHKHTLSLSRPALQQHYLVYLPRSLAVFLYLCCSFINAHASTRNKADSTENQKWLCIWLWRHRGNLIKGFPVAPRQCCQM